jgi:D-alanyl-D-alanine carboxypeptidase (penicillin-binding protein 5/6)
MISRRFFTVILALVLWSSALRAAVAAQAFIIIDGRTGYVLQEQESRQKRQIGSLTKIATASVVLDWAEHKSGDLNQMVAIPPEAFVGVSENNIKFQPGDAISLRDLLYAALVQSDNIAAYALAHHVGSTISLVAPAASDTKIMPVDIFVSQMNALAKQLKMERTRFVNPHGIDDNVKSLPYSTAEDMARLSRYAMNKAAFRFYVSQKTRQINFRRGSHTLSYMLRNTNELVGTRGIDGVKTGRTARAGECLVLSANRESEIVKQGGMTTVYPRHLIVVLLGSANRFAEGSGLVDRGWQLYDQWAAAGRLVDPNKNL